MAEPTEVYNLSDSEVESDCFDPYECDPVFQTKEELDKFLKTCNIQKNVDSDDEDIDYVFKVKKKCSCGQCADIYSGNYEHICCQQYSKWKKDCNSEERFHCITQISAFSAATNQYAVRNILLQLHRQRKMKITGLPKNNQMRYGFYKASILFIGKLYKSNFCYY